MTVPPQFWRRIAFGAGLTVSGLLPLAATAQQLDLMRGGPIDITASDGLEWRRAEQEFIARGNTKATRGDVTVTADRMVAWYRSKKPGNGAPAQATPPAATAGLPGDTSTDNSEIYRMEADGNVHIFTQTDRAQADKAVFDMDQSVMVMTGHDLKLTTPNDTLTARDDVEYWPQKHMMVARGDAVVATNDGKRIAADTLVAYTTDNSSTDTARSKPAAPPPQGADALASSGKVQRVEAFGHVTIRTPTDTVTGDRGIYLPETGMARLVGNVQITRGQNQLSGAEADVDMKTGVATLVATPSGRAHGLIVPNDSGNNTALDTAPPGGGKPGAAEGKPGTGPAPNAGKAP